MLFQRKLQSPYLVAIVIGVVYLGLLVWLTGHFNGDALGFVHRGTVFSEGNPAGTRGYDGQFYYYTAVDPWTAAQHMDNAAFRLQRIFYPLIIMAVLLGQKDVLPYVMILINYLSVVCGTLLVALLLARWGRSPWFALGYSLCAGVPVALTFDTAEPLAFALVALGVFMFDRADPQNNRPAIDREEQPDTALPAREDNPRRSSTYGRFMLWGCLALAAALLTRELALYFVAGYAAAALYMICKDLVLGLVAGDRGALPARIRGSLRREGPLLLVSIAALVPITLWSAYLSFTSRYLGVSFVQPFEHIPFIAFWLQFGYPHPRSMSYAAQYIVPTAVFGVLALWRFFRTWQGPSPLLIALLGNVHLMTFLPRLGYQHQVASSRYLLGLALAAVLWAGTARPRWLLWLTLLFALSFLAYLYGLVRQDPAYLW